MQHCRVVLPGDSSPLIYSLRLESTPLSKLASIITLAVSAALLAGCANTSDEPDAQPAANSESASPSAIPTAEETSTPTPDPSEEPSEEPTPEPIVETPEQPIPDPEPLPTGPNDPFVPPPHGEPNPLIPVTPGVPGVPHSDPAYFDWVKVTPVPVSGAEAAPTATIQQGQTLAVIGEGYVPGQHVYVMLGWPNTDTNYILEPATAVADQNGYFIYQVVIGTNVPPRNYVVVLSPRNVESDVRETSRRYHNLVITAG